MWDLGESEKQGSKTCYESQDTSLVATKCEMSVVSRGARRSDTRGTDAYRQEEENTSVRVCFYDSPQRDSSRY